LNKKNGELRSNYATILKRRLLENVKGREK
jgi:hypothetical protein